MAVVRSGYWTTKAAYALFRAPGCVSPVESFTREPSIPLGVQLSAGMAADLFVDPITYLVSNYPSL